MHPYRKTGIPSTCRRRRLCQAHTPPSLPAPSPSPPRRLALEVVELNPYYRPSGTVTVKRDSVTLESVVYGLRLRLSVENRGTTNAILLGGIARVVDRDVVLAIAPFTVTDQDALRSGDMRAFLFNSDFAWQNPTWLPPSLTVLQNSEPHLQLERCGGRVALWVRYASGIQDTVTADFAHVTRDLLVVGD